MRKIVLYMLLVFTVFAIGATGALASTINFDGTHSFSLSVLRSSTSTYLTPVSGNITTAFTDYATTNPDEGTAKSTGPTAIVIGSPSSVTATQPAGIWLIDRTDTVGYSGPLGGGKYGGTITRNFTALGPDPTGIDPLLPNVGQSNATARTQLLHLVYTAPTTSHYVFDFADTYSSQASVDQTTGSSFDVNYFSGYTQMNVKIAAGAGNGSINYATLYDKTVGSLGSSTPIDSFFDSTPDTTFTLGPVDFLVNAGTQMTLDVYLTSYYDAQTSNAPSVPVPPAVLLLGSGLIGLIGIRRKFTK